MSSLTSRDSQVVWHPFTSSQQDFPLLPIVRAAGVWLHTENGRQILDAIASWWVNLHGHGHPCITEAIAEQATRLDHVIFAGCTHEPAVRLAERLLNHLPAGMSKCFYSDDGSTSVEVAIKLALQYWHNIGTPRTHVVALEGAYHGDTFGAMSVGGRGVFHNTFDSLLFKTEHLPFPANVSQEELIERFEDIILQKEVAAFIYEPLVQGAAGMRNV